MRVLVIEDDKDIIELVRYNLEKDGFQVAASLGEAIDRDCPVVGYKKAQVRS